MQRFRIDYAKTHALRYIGSLDLQKIWERYLRRAALPLAYTQGFHPQPRLQQAAPLPLGYLGEHELLDIWLDPPAPISPQFVERALKETPQPGIEINKVEEIALNAPALATYTLSADYRVLLLDPVDYEDLSHRVHNLLGTTNLHRERRGKAYDLRPLIEALEVLPPENGLAALWMRLSARPAAMGRPEEVVAAMGYDPFAVRIIRLCVHFLPDIVQESS